MGGQVTVAGRATRIPFMSQQARNTTHHFHGPCRGGTVTRKLDRPRLYRGLPVFESARKLSVGWIAAIIAADIAFTWGGVTVVFPLGILAPLHEATGGILGTTLTVNLAGLALIVAA